MLCRLYIFILILTLYKIWGQAKNKGQMIKDRERRYLVYTDESQYGVYTTLSLAIESDSYVSVAWFFEASYYNVDNSTLFEYLLGDIATVSRHREDRSIQSNDILTRRSTYIFIETMLEKHGYPGRACLLRAICDNAEAHFLHNGLLGDLLYFILTPSTSMSEDDIEDCFYEAEYRGLEKKCFQYIEDCPYNPLENISLAVEDVFR